MTGTPGMPGTLAWRETEFQGGSAAARTALLRRDGERIVVAVEFPPGWERPQDVHYLGAEEFVVLRGDLTVSGVRYEAGDYGYVPPRATRAGTHTKTGCLAIAFFDGDSKQRAGASSDPPADPPLRVEVSE